MKCYLYLFILLLSMPSNAQIERVEPPNWWVGFNKQSLQLMIYGKDINKLNPSIDYKGVELTKVHRAESPNYLFIDFVISEDTAPGIMEIVFSDDSNNSIEYQYTLSPRNKRAGDYVGFDSSDVIYLITPDRFANGDPSNDIIEGMHEKSIDRFDDYARHGGDIRGIIDHLDYIVEMGFTAIWSSPLLENNMPTASYHGYAITDFYTVDPRFGTLEEYKELAKKSDELGIKLIMDQVANHCGQYHWWMSDLPFNDWINYQARFKDKEELITSSHRRTTNQDPYSSEIDKAILNDGWFVSAMPDLNQRNPYLASYIIQNSVWWIETLGLGGIRQDTYPYPDKNFMADWAGAIMREYPNFNIVGEEWSYNPLLVGYWQDGAQNRDGYKSNLKTTMDFPMQRLISQGLNEDEQWDKGLIKIYEGLANDFYYANPQSILIFSDNHDMDRVFTQLEEDVEKTKMAMSLILTLPRIPQIYYGTEILMQNSDKPGDHGLIRTDFPGGWKNDKINAFSSIGLAENEEQMQLFMKKLLNYRKNSEAISKGRTVHFVPENGIYVLFRSLGNETVMLIINKNKEETILDLSRFKEMGIEGKRFKNIISNEEISMGQSLQLAKQGCYMFSNKF